MVHICIKEAHYYQCKVSYDICKLNWPKDEQDKQI